MTYASNSETCAFTWLCCTSATVKPSIEMAVSLSQDTSRLLKEEIL
jgi:hypothetical protein